MPYQLFTSESVAAGHPDKIADAISDALLDALLEQDPYSRAGIETIVGADLDQARTLHTVRPADGRRRSRPGRAQHPAWHLHQRALRHDAGDDDPHLLTTGPLSPPTGLPPHRRRTCRLLR